MTNITLQQLVAKHGRATPDESDTDFVNRMVAESKVVVLSREDARNLRRYLKAGATADRLDVPVLQWDAPAAPVDDTGTTVVGRDTARNLQAYMATRAIAKATGSDWRISDYRAPGE